MNPALPDDRCAGMAALPGFFIFPKKIIINRSLVIKSFYFCPTLTTSHAGDD